MYLNEYMTYIKQLVMRGSSQHSMLGHQSGVSPMMALFYWYLIWILSPLINCKKIVRVGPLWQNFLDPRIRVIKRIPCSTQRGHNMSTNLKAKILDRKTTFPAFKLYHAYNCKNGNSLWHFIICKHDKYYAQLSWKGFYKLGARLDWASWDPSVVYEDMYGCCMFVLKYTFK